MNIPQSETIRTSLPLDIENSGLWSVCSTEYLRATGGVGRRRHRPGTSTRTPSGASAGGLRVYRVASWPARASMRSMDSVVLSAPPLLIK